ncbi:hypothetical protein MIMGU_mgv1a017135mg [Erythranthe guttata]|uniref:Secreted protein n=1 Tax=Erythranthe guttata TaxID=4155 RepID=A0A022RGF0_ERYGU|nr:hypothetical protein MIMGU_mgv1a017135mg [Erythranthe guttata]
MSFILLFFPLKSLIVQATPIHKYIHSIPVDLHFRTNAYVREKNKKKVTQIQTGTNHLERKPSKTNASGRYIQNISKIMYCASQKLYFGISCM